MKGDKKSIPIWFKVLEHFDKNNYIRNGATIPFLIGSEKLIDSKKNLLTVTDFIVQAINQDLPSKIKMLRCPGLGEIVIGLMDNGSLYMDKQYDIYQKHNELFITDNSFQNQNTDYLIDKLHQEYQTHINNQNFTFESGEWIPYTDLEKERIKEITTKK